MALRQSPDLKALGYQVDEDRALVHAAILNNPSCG